MCFIHVAQLSLTGISERSSSFVSFVFKSTAIPFASRIVLQQLSTLSLIKTRLRSKENAIFYLSLEGLMSIAEVNEIFHVYTLAELCTLSCVLWLVEKNRRHVDVFSRHCTNNSCDNNQNPLKPYASSFYKLCFFSADCKSFIVTPKLGFSVKMSTILLQPKNI